MKRALKLWHLAAAAMLGVPAAAPASGLPGSCHAAMLQPLRLREHEAHVTLQLGFARTEVIQTIHNPNAAEVEAILHVPMPESAAFAEVEIGEGVDVLRGEVLTLEDAIHVSGTSGLKTPAAGTARRIENGDVEIRIHRLEPESTTRVRWVTYAPHALREGKGALVYPASQPGELPGREIWTPQTELQGTFRLTVDLRYASPIAGISAPDFEGEVRITRPAEDRVRVTLEAESGELGEFTRLDYEVDQPESGAVDLIAHRRDADGAGVFMMVLTPPSDFATEPGPDVTPVLHFPGGRVSETSPLEIDALERGEQHVVFGRYNEGGRARVVINEGAPELTRFDTIASFPVRDEETPELERLWAQSRIDWLEGLAQQGRFDPKVMERETTRLASEHQILTRSNVMMLLDEEAFRESGVVRRNGRRIETERMAQTLRSGLPVWRTRIDLGDAFFTSKGRHEGGCCLMDVSGVPAMPYGIDLSTPSPAPWITAAEQR